MDLKNILLTLSAFILLSILPFSYAQGVRTVTLRPSNPLSGKSLTLSITNPLAYDLLGRENLASHDIFLRLWQEWANRSEVQLTIQATSDPTYAFPWIEGNHLFLPDTFMPDPRFDSALLSSTSLVRNSLSLITGTLEVDSTEGLIGVLKALYPLWASQSSSPIPTEKVRLYDSRETLIQDFKSSALQAVIDYPLSFWGHPQAPRTLTFTSVSLGFDSLQNLSPELSAIWRQLQDQVQSLPVPVLKNLVQTQQELFAQAPKPTLTVSLESDYSPFSSRDSITGHPTGLLVDYAQDFLNRLGVPYQLVFYNPSQPSDISWGLAPRHQSEENQVFSIYATPSVLLARHSADLGLDPVIGSDLPTSFLESFQTLYPDAHWSPVLSASDDAWILEGARASQAPPTSSHNLLSQTDLLSDLVPFYLESSPPFKEFFQTEGENLFNQISRMQWTWREQEWITDPRYRTLSDSPIPLYLTDDEKLWLYHHPILKIGVHPSGDFLESTEDSTQASLTDVFLGQMASALNLEIKKVPIQNGEHLKELLLGKEIDVFFSYGKSAPLVESQSFPLWNLPLAFYAYGQGEIQNLSPSHVSSLTLGTWSKISDSMSLNNSFQEILYFPSPDKAIENLIMKRTDLVLMDSYNANLLASRYKEKLQVLPSRSSLSLPLQVNVRANEPLLFTMLEKAYLSLAPSQRAELVQDWVQQSESNPSTLESSLLFLPFLITLLLIVTINYKSFSTKLRHRDDLNKKLFEAEKLARQANASKSEFIANISHELRTCLNGIVGMTELLKKTHLDKNQEEYFSILRSSSQTLVTIVDDLLDVSRIENRRIHLENTPFSLISYLKGIVENTKKMNTNDKISILLRTFNLPNELIKGDFIRLGQILNNFLRNSLKFTEAGLVKLTVSSFKRQYKKIWIEFSIEDTGIGIPEDKLSDIFEPFSQAHDDLSVKMGGVGLGLYICQSIIALMDGSPIEVKSEVGKGTTFSFKIPFQLTNLGLEHIEEYSTEDFKEKRALILEKNPTQVLHFSELLLKMGLSYKIASSASEVLSFLQSETFDLFFVEEIFLKADPSTLSLIPYHNYEKSKIFLLAESGNTPEKLKNLVTEQGFHNYFMYPYEKQEVLLKLKTFFQEQANSRLSRVMTERYHFKNTRILLVEDHTINQKVLATMLENVGITIDLASTGKEALLKFKRNEPYDLIFMDIQLPDKNGFIITKEIRSLESLTRRLHTPVVSITANAMHGYKQLCLEKGLDDYLSKPIFFESLLTILKNWIPEEKQVITTQEETLQEIPDIPFMPNLPYLDLPQTLTNLDLTLEDYLPILAKTYESCYTDLFLPFQAQIHNPGERDKKEIAHHAHALAGILGNLGSTELFKDLKACENWAMAESEENAEILLRETVEKVATFFRALRPIASPPEEPKETL